MPALSFAVTRMVLRPCGSVPTAMAKRLPSSSSVGGSPPAATEYTSSASSAEAASAPRSVATFVPLTEAVNVRARGLSAVMAP